MKKLMILLLIAASSSILAQDNFSEKGSYLCSQRKSSNPHSIQPLRSPNTPEHKFDVLEYTWFFDLYSNFSAPYSQFFTADGIIKFKVDTALSQIKLNCINSSIAVQLVGLAGTSFTHSDDTLTINLNRTYNPGEVVDVSIIFNHLNVEDGHFYCNGGFVFTDNEPEGARYWFPSYDRPYDKAKWDFTAKVPADVLLGSNGRLADSTTVADTTWYHYVSRDPIATYLMVISACNDWNLDIIYWDRPSTPGEPMPIRFYYNPGENPTYMKQLVPQMADYFSENYGEHPFEKDGFASLNDEFTWGGMENQTLTSICTGCWFESLICHEFAHQWFGDMISPGTWADLWLNEGFATWSESFWYESYAGYSAYKDDVENNASYYLSGNPGWPVYVPEWAVNTPSNNILFNYAITYCKSACVLHLLRYSLGDDLFFPAIYDYATDTTDFKYKNAVTDDFQASLEESTGQDLDWFFDSWVKQPNHPVYHNEYNIHDNGNGTWNVNFYVNQVQTNAGFFPIPVELYIYFYDATDTTIRVMNDVNQQVFNFTFDVQPAVVKFDFTNEIVLKQATLAVGIDEGEIGSQQFSLGQNYPNPVTSFTEIAYSLPERSMVDLSLFDMNGREIMKLVEGEQDLGTHILRADVSGLNSGVYFYRLRAGQYSETKRLIVAK
jgi:aminopeptidase N